MWNSSQTVCSSSSDGQLRVEDVGRRCSVAGICSRKQRQTVVLPAPISPVSSTKPPPPSDPVQQVRQRLAVAFAHEQVARIGRDRERLLRQAEIRRVHAPKDTGGLPPISGRDERRASGPANVEGARDQHHCMMTRPSQTRGVLAGPSARRRRAAPAPGRCRGRNRRRRRRGPSHSPASTSSPAGRATARQCRWQSPWRRTAPAPRTPAPP